MKLWPVPDHERALWQKQYVLPFILDPYESSDDKYLPSTQMARKILRKHIEEYRNAVGNDLPNQYPNHKIHH